MSIQITISAQSPGELLAYLGAIQPSPSVQMFRDLHLHSLQEGEGGLPPGVEAQPDIVNGLGEFDPPASAVQDVTDDAAAAAEVADALSETSAEAPKRRRGRPPKVKAAPEPAEAAPEVAQAAPEVAQAAPAVAEASPFGDPEPAAPAARDPEVDWGLALELLRGVYDRPGAASKVNAVLAEYGVAKFTQIPKAQGSELLAKALVLDDENPA